MAVMVRWKRNLIYFVKILIKITALPDELEAGKMHVICIQLWLNL